MGNLAVRSPRRARSPAGVPVVVVDDAGRDAAAIDGGDHPFVVLVDLRVGLEPPSATPAPSPFPPRRSPRPPEEENRNRSARSQPWPSTPGSARSSSELRQLRRPRSSRDSTPARSAGRARRARAVRGAVRRGTRASIAGATGASRRCSASRTSSASSSTTRTSAGDDFPSRSIWLEISGLSPDRTATLNSGLLGEFLRQHRDHLRMLARIERKRLRPRSHAGRAPRGRPRWGRAPRSRGAACGGQAGRIASSCLSLSSRAAGANRRN